MYFRFLQVFDPSRPDPIFFLANRGHHADIGGSTPGSMPSNSTSINEEGAVFKSFKLVDAGVFQEQGTLFPLCWEIIFNFNILA